MSSPQRTQKKKWCRLMILKSSSEQKKKLGVCFGHEKKNTYHGIEGAFSGPWFSIMLNQSACFWDALKTSDVNSGK